MYKGRKVLVMMAAAGSSRRMGEGPPKMYLQLGGMPVLGRTVKVFADHPAVDELWLAIRPEDRETCIRQIAAPYGGGKVKGLVAGGDTRQRSMEKLLAALEQEEEDCLVLVQDGARPFLTPALIDRVLEAACAEGAAVPALPVKDTIKYVEDGLCVETPDRSRLYAVQTPQGFALGILRRAYEAARRKGLAATDDASLVEALGLSPRQVAGEEQNWKITVPADLPAGEALLAQRQTADRLPRTGLGADVHALAEGRPLVLGGVVIPFEKGLAGHSDADVLTHAVMDAILGACGLGDIGRHFPDKDPAYKDISSLLLLKTVGEKMRAAGFELGNVDALLLAQRPKIAPFAKEMEEKLAEALSVSEGKVHVKASTTEKLGFTGREEGMASQAVALVVPLNKGDGTK